MKTNLLFCLVGLCLVTITINVVSSEKVQEKPLIVEEELDLTSYHVEKSYHRGTKKIYAGKYVSFREKGPFSLWYSVYSAGHFVDIMFMKDDDYQSWIKSGKNPRYISKYSHIRVSESEATGATVLNDEYYWLVIYNNNKYADKAAVVDYEIRYQKTSEGLPVWAVVLLCVGLTLLLGLCLVVSLLYGRSHRSGDSWGRGWGWRDRDTHKPQTEGYQNKTTWRVSASTGIHDPERQPLNVKS